MTHPILQHLKEGGKIETYLFHGGLENAWAHIGDIDHSIPIEGAIECQTYSADDIEDVWEWYDDNDGYQEWAELPMKTEEDKIIAERTIKNGYKVKLKCLRVQNKEQESEDFTTQELMAISQSALASGWDTPICKACNGTGIEGEDSPYEIVAAKILAIGHRYAQAERVITSEEIKFAADLIRKYIPRPNNNNSEI